jgi:hypothetical protein
MGWKDSCQGPQGSVGKLIVFRSSSLLMLAVIHTLDYEIHGNGDGCPWKLMVEPTARLLDLFDEYGAKLTIMADVAEILKFRSYAEQTGKDTYYSQAIESQLKDAIRRGHDVQLHLHCSYFNARHENGKWLQDWSEYNFAGLPEARINEVVAIGKQYLEDLLCPVDPGYRVSTFRAANWSVSPSRNVVRALAGHGITYETSVFKYGRRQGLVNFNYTDAYSNLLPWPVSEDNICRRDDSSDLIEVPIYSENRWIGAFLSWVRVQRAWEGRQHRIVQLKNGGEPSSVKRPSSSKVSRLATTLLKKHSWKADFNQCTGRQLIQALRRASAEHDIDPTLKPFVLIGHSKLFSHHNERSLRPFLSHVKNNHHSLRFGVFGDLPFGKEPLSRAAFQPR